MTKMTPKAQPPFRKASGRGNVRRALVEAALDLFSERHADGVTIDDIVNKAGVAKGSFYNYFTDRENLVRSIVNEIRDKIESEISNVNDHIDIYPLKICRAICVYIRFFFKNPAYAMFLMKNDMAVNEIIMQDVNHGLRADVRSGLKSGDINVPNADIGSLFILGISHIAIYASTQEHDEDRMASRIQQLCKLMLRGLGLEENKAELISAQAVEDLIRE